jgi:hypothetical protein
VVPSLFLRHVLVGASSEPWASKRRFEDTIGLGTLKATFRVGNPCQHNVWTEKRALLKLRANCSTASIT